VYVLEQIADWHSVHWKQFLALILPDGGFLANKGADLALSHFFIHS
jgi:hypothetical protein